MRTVLIQFEACPSLPSPPPTHTPSTITAGVTAELLVQFEACCRRLDIAGSAESSRTEDKTRILSEVRQPWMGGWYAWQGGHRIVEDTQSSTLPSGRSEVKGAREGWGAGGAPQSGKKPGRSLPLPSPQVKSSPGLKAMHPRLREALVTSGRAGIRWSGSLRLEALYCAFLLEVLIRGATLEAVGLSREQGRAQGMVVRGMHSGEEKPTGLSKIYTAQEGAPYCGPGPDSNAVSGK